MLYEAALDRSAYSLLEEYCRLPFLNTFSLAGGTALALRLGHRLSYVLDLFSYQKFEVNRLHQELESYFGSNYVKRGNLSNALFTTVNNIKTDFVFDYGKQTNAIEVIESVRLYSFEENIAMKLNAICGRGRKRDFFDLYFILEKFSLTEVTNFFLSKYGEDKLLSLYKSITYFEDAANDEDLVLLNKKVTWENVKKTILKKMKTMRF